jgi:hypothetical protein
MSENMIGSGSSGLMGSDPIKSKESNIFQRIRRKLRLVEAIELGVLTVALVLLAGNNSQSGSDTLLILLSFFITFLFFWGWYLLHIRLARAGGTWVDVILWIIEGVFTLGVSVVALLIFDINRFIMVRLFYRGDAPVEYACSPGSKARFKSWRDSQQAAYSARIYRSQTGTTVNLESPYASQIDRLLYSFSMFARIEAVEQLANLTTSDEYVVAALMLAKDNDANSKVKDTAATALQSPIHQAIINQNPDAVAKITAQLTEGKKRQSQAVQRSAVADAAKGEQQMKIGALLFFGGLIVTFITYGMASSSSSGGTYLVCWGPVIFGLLTMLQGYRQSNR